MSRSRLNSARLWLLSAALASTAAAVAAAPPSAGKYGLGKPATLAEIAGWDIDVGPDGAGLPQGRGSVGEGRVVYDAQCAGCHGTFGESNSNLQIAGGVGTLASDAPVRTTGSKLNYAPTLFDYIRRAMPFNAPQSLTADEVYALTAYVLYLNEIIGADAVLDPSSLAQLRMPNRDGFTTAHGFMRADGKPDTANVACMKNCSADVRLTSELPAYALDQHGDLALQRRALGSIAGVQTIANKSVATKEATGFDLAKRSGCASCHAVDTVLVGPAFRQIATRYGRADIAAGNADAETLLVNKVKSGGVGKWGELPMPGQPQVDAADARAIVRWILTGAR